MIEAVILACMTIAGGVLGVIFYGGLWWTVRKRPTRWQGVWFLGSFLLRAAVAVGGLGGLARGDWRSWLACLAGFFFARVAITRTLAAGPRRDPALPLVHDP